VIVVLDSNVWRSELGLSSGMGALARLFMVRHEATLAVPEVIKLEVEHHLHLQLTTLCNELRDSHRQLLGLFGALRELVLPSEAEISTKVNSFFASIEIQTIDVPFSIESAKSSLLKTIRKTPPCDKTQEFKDGVLWSDCVSLLQRDDVTLVTSDKAFYKDRDYSKGLSPNLVTELNGAKFEFNILPSLQELVKELRVEIDVPDPDLIAECRLRNAEGIQSMLQRVGFSLGEPTEVTKVVFATEIPTKVFVDFDVKFAADDIRGEGRTDAILSVTGQCYFSPNDGRFESYVPRKECITFKEPSGEIISSCNIYVGSTAFTGHRKVSHTVRQPIFTAGR
jgi:PIN domain